MEDLYEEKDLLERVFKKTISEHTEKKETLKSKT